MLSRLVASASFTVIITAAKPDLSFNDLDKFLGKRNAELLDIAESFKRVKEFNTEDQKTQRLRLLESLEAQVEVIRTALTRDVEAEESKEENSAGSPVTAEESKKSVKRTTLRFPSVSLREADAFQDTTSFSEANAISDLLATDEIRLEKPTAADEKDAVDLDALESEDLMSDEALDDILGSFFKS